MVVEGYSMVYSSYPSPPEIINCNTYNFCHKQTENKNFILISINNECVRPVVSHTLSISSALFAQHYE